MPERYSGGLKKQDTSKGDIQESYFIVKSHENQISGVLCKELEGASQRG